MDKNNEYGPNDISIKEVFLKMALAFNYIKSKWVIILIFFVLGSLSGLFYALYKKPLFIATSTFVLDDSKGSSGLGQYAGLASVAGIDIGGNSAGGIFEGDNILVLYKSRVMIEKTLLSSFSINNQKFLLIDWYISINKLRERWKEKDGINSISFNGNPENFSRKQDSIITDIVETLNQKSLVVSKLDKRLSIIKVDVITDDELFSKVFNNKLVETVNNFYTQTKTKKSYQNIQVLQKQADSVKKVLNYSINGVASAIEAAPNANPALLTLRVPSQRKQIDVQTNTVIYSEIVKNLEVSKLSFRQEAPLIQVIDQPVLPLPAYVINKYKAMLIGGFCTGLLVIVVFLVRKFFAVLLK